MGGSFVVSVIGTDQRGLKRLIVPDYDIMRITFSAVINASGTHIMEVEDKR